MGSLEAEHSANEEEQGAAPGLSEDVTPETCLAKPEIISSTSFFISAKIRENSQRIDDSAARDVNVENVIAAIKMEMRGAMIVPASNFSSAEQLVDSYGETYNMQYLSSADKLKVAEAYVEGIELAKAEGRYFGRNPSVIAESFGTDEEAVNAFIEFAAKFGYSPKNKYQVGADGKADPKHVKDLFHSLCYYYKPGDYLLHTSEHPSWAEDLIIRMNAEGEQ